MTTEELTYDQKLARRVEGTYRNFMAFPDEHAYTVTALWVLHAHLRKPSGEFVPYITPRLYFGSQEPGAGKSLATELTALMAGGRMIGEPTAPGLTTMLNIERMTPGMDEIDLLFGTSARSHSSIRTILNMGYKRGGNIIRERLSEVDWQEVHGPIVMNGKNLKRFLNHDSFDALRTRTIAIPLTKKDPSVKLSRWRPSVHEETLMTLARELRAWGIASSRYVTKIDVEEIIPELIDNRDREIWEVLFQIADHIGGVWPDRVNLAARAYVLGERTLERGVQVDPYDELLANVRSVFEETEDYLPTVEILDRLDLLENPGQLRREWTSIKSMEMGLANGLRESGVAKVRKRIGDEQPWGYTRASVGLEPIKVERVRKVRTTGPPRSIPAVVEDEAA